MPVPSDVIEFVKTNNLEDRSAWRTNIKIALITACYLVAFAIGKESHFWLIQVGVWLVQALILVGCFTAIHEAVHNNLYHSKLANRIVGNLLAIFICSNFSSYRYAHYHHHRYTAILGDPEIYPNEREIVRNLSEYCQRWLARATFPKNHLLKSYQALRGVFPYFCENRKHQHDIVVDSVWYFLTQVILIVLFVLYPRLMVDIWLLPFLIYCMFLSPLFMFPQHHNCDPEDKYFGNTRTIISNPIVRFFLWNHNYHAEHHLCPSVPFYNLPKLHQQIKDRVKNISPSHHLSMAF